MQEIEDKETEELDFESLFKQIKHDKKRLFLENYPKFRVITQTCEAIGIDDSTVRSWYKDSIFNDAFSALKKEVSQKLILLHEKNIDNVAFADKTPAQSRIFGSLVRLRAEAPDKYREKPVTETRISGNVVIRMDIPPYRDELPEGKMPQISIEKPKELKNATKQEQKQGENEAN